MTDITIFKDGFSISNDKSKLDINSIHSFLSTKAYWALNIPIEKVRTSLQNSLCFGVYDQEKQIGFAKVISDFSSVAYLGDVYILEDYRGRGLSKWLIKTVMEHPDLQGLRRWILLTSDAHGLYSQLGWKEIADPSRWMELHNKNVYAQN